MRADRTEVLGLVEDQLNGCLAPPGGGARSRS